MAYELTCWECSGHRYCKSFIRCLGGHHFFRQGQPTIPTPEGGASGLAWAEGTLWVGQHRKRKIHQVDPQTGAILRTIDSNRFVTGVTWVGGELWHGTWEAEESELRRIDPQSGEVLEQIDMPAGIAISGLESNGGDIFFCGGGNSGKVRAVRRPRPDTPVKPKK